MPWEINVGIRKGPNLINRIVFDVYTRSTLTQVYKYLLYKYINEVPQPYCKILNLGYRNKKKNQRQDLAGL